jgi:hypothetical protein
MDREMRWVYRYFTALKAQVSIEGDEYVGCFEYKPGYVRPEHHTFDALRKGGRLIAKYAANRS